MLYAMLMSYKELHKAGEEWIVRWLKAKGHKVLQEAALNHEVVFDVYDATTSTAYEVLTAKIVRSGHEQDEMILYKLFHYLLLVPRLRFYIVSFGKDELEVFHSLHLEHWHLYSKGWLKTELRGPIYHKGKSALEVANAIYKAMVNYAPLHEWIAKDRRHKHPKAAVEKDFARLTAQLGLPKNFLIGMWRDWRLLWVWRLEYILKLWKKRKPSREKMLHLLAKMPRKE
jgi:hypothetical protein